MDKDSNSKENSSSAPNMANAANSNPSASSLIVSIPRRNFEWKEKYEKKQASELSVSRDTSRSKKYTSKQIPIIGVGKRKNFKPTKYTASSVNDLRCNSIDDTSRDTSLDNSIVKSVKAPSNLKNVCKNKDTIPASKSSSQPNILNSLSCKQPNSSITIESAAFHNSKLKENDYMKKASNLLVACNDLRAKTSNRKPILRGVKKRKNFKPKKYSARRDSTSHCASIDFSHNASIDDNGLSKSDEASLNLQDNFRNGSLNIESISAPKPSSFQNAPTSSKQPACRLIAETAYQDTNLKEKDDFKQAQYASIATNRDILIDDKGLSKSDEVNPNLQENNSKDGSINNAPNPSLSQNVPNSTSLKQPTCRLIGTTTYQNSNLKEGDELQQVSTVCFDGKNYKIEKYTSKGNFVSIVNLSTKNNYPVIKVNPEVQVTESLCRHLETLSARPVTGPVIQRKTIFSDGLSSSGISFTAPALKQSCRSESLNRENNTRHEPSHISTIPKIPISKIPIPKIPIPKIPIPKIPIPKISIPKISSPKTLIPKTLIPKTLIPKTLIPKIPTSTIPTPTILIPKVPIPTDNSELPMSATNAESNIQTQNRGASVMGDILVDEKNSNQCVACGEICRNLCGLRYTEQECNTASFIMPKKSSQDKHSTNNLQRKHSFTTTETAHLVDKVSSIYPHSQHSSLLQDNFSRQHDPQTYSRNIANFYSDRIHPIFLPSPMLVRPQGLPGRLNLPDTFSPTFLVSTSTSNSTNLKTTSDKRDDTPTFISSTPRAQSPSSSSKSILKKVKQPLTSTSNSTILETTSSNRDDTPTSMSSTPRAQSSSSSSKSILKKVKQPLTPTSNSTNLETTSNSRDNTPTSTSSTPHVQSPSSSSSKDIPKKVKQPLTLGTELIANKNGRFPCNFCQKGFADADRLRNHYEGTHLSRLIPCPAEDCFKVFLTYDDKDKHCEDENYHIYNIPRTEKKSL